MWVTWLGTGNLNVNKIGPVQVYSKSQKINTTPREETSEGRACDHV